MIRWISLWAMLAGSTAIAATPELTALRTRIENTGRATRIDSLFTLNLGHVVPSDEAGPHVADYVGEVGTISGGAFIANSITAVSEVWTKNAAGNWEIDQWIFGASLEAEVRTAWHLHVVETPQRMVLSSMWLPVGDLRGAEIHQRWASTLEPWLEGRY